MDIITMAMCKPKIINLDTYWVDGKTISDVLFQLFGQGGGTYELAGDCGVLADLKTDKAIEIRFTFTTTVISTPVVVRTIKRNNGDVGQVSFECLVNLNGVHYRVYVYISAGEVFLKIGTV